MKWSPHQETIFDFLEKGQGAATVIAVAGSGKTTTSVEANRRADGSSIFMAFNKSIATELASRGVNGRTFHSVTCTPVLRALGVRDVTPDKTSRLIDLHMSRKDIGLYAAFASRMVGLAKNAGFGVLVDSDWEALADHHDLYPDAEGASFQVGLEWAEHLFKASIEANAVDFDDMLYQTVYRDLTLARHEFVFVDEAQDTNIVQREIIRRLLSRDGRVIAVGDPAQAIYGFRGADSSSIAAIGTEFGAKELPLTVTWRCGTEIVKYARQWCSHIEAAPGAHAGEVVEWTDSKPPQFTADDLIVCRTTRPIISYALKLIRAGVPCTVKGKEIGDELKALVRKMKAIDNDDLIDKINEWENKQLARAITNNKPAHAEVVSDKAETIRAVADAAGDGDVIAAIDRLFVPRGGVTLSTIHKAKGLEADTVYWLEHKKCPAKWATRDWQQEQERNLCYVAATRAKNKLVLM